MVLPTRSADESTDRVLEGLVLDTTCVVATAKTFKALADQCQDLSTRTRLTQHPSNLPRALCAVLQRTLNDLRQLSSSESSRADDIFLLIQTLRCMGNLSADNNDARAQLLEHGGVASIGSVLGIAEAQSEPLLTRAAFGAALNVALDHAECSKALLAAGALHPHLQVLGTGVPSDVWPIVCMSLDNLCEHDDAAAQFEGHSDYAASVVRTLSLLSRRADGDQLARGAMRTLVWVLCETVEKSAPVRRQLCSPSAVLAIFDLLDFYLSLPKPKEEDDDDSTPAPAPALPNRPIRQSAANRYADAVTQAIVGVSGEDEALAALFSSQPLTSRLVSILTSNEAGSPRADAMAAAAALCLGNLARTDDHCTRLVAEHSAVVTTLIHEWLIPRSVNVRTRHAASGLLKNLCLPPANRPSLAAMGLVAAAAASVKSAVVPIQANCIGILRHLANGSPEPDTVLEMVNVALADALSVVKETDVDAIRCEATRLIATIAKRVYLTEGNRVARDVIDDSVFDLVTPLVRLVMLDGVRHPLLRQESLVALTVLATQPRHVGGILRLLVKENSAPLAKPPTTDAITEVEQNGFAEVLADLITNGADTPFPQAALQAKSLVTQLATSSATESDEGVSVLHTMLIPLLS
ncbi:Rap1 GTPase-GDP dissociation stimulator 1 [Coemansia sp. S100]|nr:Rap1 GTPase-GDP dissociation stimulator 1 [Coemansia sp. S17]KAJ2094996.1 Rap1 GTPase-GDP dissociation stimulator 1 [Coemansia sp. S142-1]KAJ2099797.1 Rap1 GTPase-GDP dissociation stimulator 1 [Coemansia sp. S100]